MATLSTIIRKTYTRKDGNSPIYLRIIINREILLIPLKLYWDKKLFKNGRAVEKDSNSIKAKDINLIIQDNEAKANEILIRFRLQRREITIPLFEQSWKCGAPSKDFITYMEKKMEQRLREREITLSSYRTQMVTLNHLKIWKKSLPFEVLNERIAYQFESYLTKKTGCVSINSRWGHHKNFKCYLNEAKSERIEFIHPYDYFSAKSQVGRFQPLHQNEVVDLWNTYLKKTLPSYKQDALRAFLFVCLTGMRHSDVNRFNMEWIDGDFIEFIPYKTRRYGTKVRIPTNNYILRLIMDELDVAKKNKMFQGSCEQKQNQYIREIAQKLKLSTKVSFQVGRETFATLYMEHDGKLEVLASFMGHTTTKMSEKYIKIRDRRKKEEAQRIEGFLTIKENQTQ